MSNQTSQIFESYLPLYDSIPEKWEEGRTFLVEALKKISDTVNAREIGWFLDEELISGKQFIPTATTNTGADPNQQFRTVLRKVVDVAPPGVPLVAGLNAPRAHGIVFDANFTLIDLWVAGTNSTTFTARDISGNDVVMDATNLVITSPQAFDRAFAVVEYILEI